MFKRKHKYFVSYMFNDEHGRRRFGNCNAVRNKRINTMEDIAETEKQIESVIHKHCKVIILNYQKLRR